MEDNAMEYVPSLTLNPEGEAKLPTAADIAEAVKEEVKPVVLEKDQLTAEEQKMVDDFAKQIDITDTNMVLTYGSAAQKNIANFSEATLNNVRTKDMGDVGNMLSDLVVELKGLNFDEEEKKGLFGIKKKVQKNIASLKAQYDKAEVNVDKIVDMLEKHQITLLKDTSMLDKMYDVNQSYFKELTMYIIAGKQRLEECKSTELVRLREKAEQSGLPEDAQAANDYANMINRFEKKIYDLELTRMISVQMAPQIRLIQNNDSLMIEK
ncbi:MAG: toxic anion resistance protein, partial [Oscillospiraceae bacterium]|nr:toxic anion resistance protein [Oscillospiraceae bacterium]